MRHGWWTGTKGRDEASAAAPAIELGSPLVGARLAEFARVAAAMHLAQGMRVPELRFDAGSAPEAAWPDESEGVA